MIVKQYIKDFEKLGFGMFVHFGLYSLLGRGEWILHTANIPLDEYTPLTEKFTVAPDWAEKLVSTAKNAGCKYITLTTRHHDGFSLYDTCGLNTYDAPHSAAGRDLVREFVDECRKQDIIPFFYHTLLDWWHPEFNTNFKAYLSYLRKSVEILCKNYGKIGGLWFDGQWSNQSADWEFDALYSLIRSYQPEAMIINNTGMGDEIGTISHPDIDSITFERGKPHRAKIGKGEEKYVACEMCQIFGELWGYAEYDLSFKPVGEILQNLLDCKRNTANLLLNVGPMGDGHLCDIDKGYLQKIGAWMKYYSEAIYDSYITPYATDRETDFIVHSNTTNAYYLFITKPNINHGPFSFDFDKKIKSISYLDKNGTIDFSQENGKVTFDVVGFEPGVNLLIRTLKIEVE